DERSETLCHAPLWLLSQCENFASLGKVASPVPGVRFCPLYRPTGKDVRSIKKDRRARRKHAYSVSGNGHKISPADTLDRGHRMRAAAAVGVRSRETNRRARTR